MGLMDDIKEKTGDMGNMKDRFEELRSKEMRGELDEKGREELRQLRQKFMHKDEQ